MDGWMYRKRETDRETVRVRGFVFVRVLVV
jgi:hypothetical protein